MKPTPDSLSIAEQMQVLRSSADVATWSLKRLGLPSEWRDTNEPGNTERCQEAVNRLFTITREEIEASLAAEGLQPEDLPPYHTVEGSRDGWYFIARGRTWDFYWQERGFPNFRATFDDLTEARKLLINHFIPVWLCHLHLPCRTKSGKKITEV